MPGLESVWDAVSGIGTHFLEHWPAVIGVILIGIAKAGFASGLGMLTTPLLCTAIPAREALGVVLPLLILTDLITVVMYWKKWDVRLLRWPFLGIPLGIGIGMFFIQSISDVSLKRVIGATGLLLTVLLIVRNLWYPKSVYRPKPWEGTGAGTAAGFVSTLAHAAGPVMSLYLLAQKTPKMIFVASNALYFTVMNLTKLGPFAAAGVVNWSTLKISLSYVPYLPVGVLIGWTMNRVIPQKGFNVIIYGLMIVTSIHLLFMS
jgi:uncharacterized membrane protein YfcA